ncbi:unnamed protein product [Ixodes persulcatus]
MLCGQGYDGAASMSGHLNGVQVIILETVPRALYVHCSAHSLNLALLHSCKLPSIRNCLGTMSSVFDCDLSQACDYVDDIINILSEKRRNSETEFKKIFEQSCFLLHDVNVEMTLPRIVGRQSQRSNAPSVTPEEHYRRNVYLPLLADLENQLKERFQNHKKVVVGLHMLLPKFSASASLSGIHDAVEFYLGDIASAHTLAAELAL